ncbi:uncharacterized protein LOC143277225 [Babylonia areolata]|uniref:uncharacterized protein LOC143277225 n=1 Tax=Babylonia areolata TaxID=304850 RepID=UPI003FD3F33D
MASPDQQAMSEVKIEIDVAEETGPLWMTQDQCSGSTCETPEAVTTNTSNDVIKTEPVTTNTSSDVQTEAVTDIMMTVRPDTVRSESTIRKDEDNRPAGDNQKLVKLHSSVIDKTTPQLSVSGANRTPVHKSANTSGSLLSLNRSHVCQRCFAAFVLFNSLKLHLMHVHGEKLHAVLPVPSTPSSCDAGNYSNMNVEKVADLDKRNIVQRKNNKFDDNTDKESEEKKSRRHVCDVCSKAFTKAGHLKTHKLIHTGHKQFVCDVCSKAFTLAGNLKRHKLIHTGHKQFVCDVCSKAFTEAGTLKRHKLIHTGHKQFVCDVCSKAFTLAGHLKRHKLIHTGHKQFVCDVCSKAFTEAGHLKRHKLIHTGHKQFVCDVCSKAFTEAGTLKRHKFIHTGHKQFVCDVCSKAFTEAGNLKTHKLIHTGHKQFVCDVCSKAFTQAGTLKRHKFIHTGHKQFVCDMCSKAFTHAGHLKRHKLIHTGHKQFVC